MLRNTNMIIAILIAINFVPCSTKFIAAYTRIIQIYYNCNELWFPGIAMALPGII